MKVVQRALEAGPVSQDELITSLHQAGIRVDVGVLWETCRIHGLADLRGDLWVPRGWAAAVNERCEAAGSASAGVLGPGLPAQRTKAGPPTQDRVARRADAQVQRLADSVGLGTPEPVPPVGPVPAGWNEVARGASRALADELAKVTSRRTETDVPLMDGQETGQTATRRLVRFEAQSEIGTAEGTSGLLIVQDLQIEVEVISVFGAVVTLSLPSDAPVTREATLRLDMSWLLSAQSRRLWELIDGGPGFDAAAALTAVTPEKPAATPTSPPAEVRLGSGEVERLNEGQRRAVELALTHGVTWLWGPPGTGKTTTISALVAALAARGKRVLLAAPTNAALDVAVTSLFDRAPQLAENGAVVRLGQPTDKLLNHPAGGTVLVDVVAAQRGAVLAAERVDVGQRLQQARHDLAELRRVKGPLTDEQQQRRSELESKAAELASLAEGLDRLLLQFRRKICREATVVAATAHQTVLDTLKELTFDVVVLDEASMTTAVLAMLVAGTGHGHTVIAGDFRQLPPVAVADTPAAREWLHKGPFEKAGVARAVIKEGHLPDRLAALTAQYRMRPAIGHVVSTAFYRESPLITDDTVLVRERRSRIRWASGELVALDTSRLAARTARRQGSTSRYNLMHAQVIAALLGSATTLTRDLAMITPFTAQARLLESLLIDFGLDGWASSTVHRFQGGERDIVVYDTVDTGRGVAKLHSWFTDLDPDSTGTRLLNVAASRAKDHLVVVGAFDQLHRTGSSADPLWRFFAHLLDQAVHLSWQEAVDLSDGTTEHVPSTEVLPRLREDIANATAVDMWLPSAPLVGLPKLLPALRSLPAAHGEIQSNTIWVEPDGDGYLPAEALHARREGVNIRPCTPILESSAVVGDIVWSAGASLLGSDPGVVLRTESPGFADLVRRTQRRRRSAAVPGTGQLGDECGRCQRMLVRLELPRRGAPDVRYECLSCDGSLRRGRRL
ncbi:DEAD/DEAH box helicase [Micromonospora fulviviridis]|uniref:DEAD/DEAH box helicase n=1 Tax=Micromonospora fulviviridis TaxID=47860 RepID=UPI00166E6A38|nr:AAA domain-containing protein [Micromonospora fulviviridis]